MTINEIDAFLAVVHYGSMTAAAEKLFISQPALSRRIGALEQEIGYTLLLRGKGLRSVSLTPKGTQFVLMAERWRQLWTQMQTEPIGPDASVLHVSAIGSLLSYVLFPAIQRFLAENPACDFIMETQHSYHAYDYVANGTVDIALVSDIMYAKSVEVLPLWREPMYVVAGEAIDIHPDMPPSELNVAQEIKVPWNNAFTEWHSYWFGPNIRPHIALDQMSAIENFICGPELWMIAPASVARALAANFSVRTTLLSSAPPDRYVYCLKRKHWQSEPSERFITHIKSVALENDQIHLFDAH